MGAIYCVTNLADRKMYVGKTERTAQERWVEHLEDAHRGSGTYFHRAIRKHGANGFKVTVLTESEDSVQLNELEKKYIAELRSFDPSVGYNCTLGGNGGRPNALTLEKLRKPKSDDHRRKISEHAKLVGTAHMNTPECRAKKSKALKGRVFSQATLQKMREAKLGKKHSAETNAKQSVRMTGKLNPMHGRPMPVGHQEKLQESVKKWRSSSTTEERSNISRHASKARWEKLSASERSEAIRAVNVIRWSKKRAMKIQNQEIPPVGERSGNVAS